MWFQLIPAPADPNGEAPDFNRLAKHAADALGLSSRPGWTDWWRHDEGCLLVARGEDRWLYVSERYGKAAADRLAAACGASAQECDAPEEAFDLPKRWAHAFVPISAQLARNARDEAPNHEHVRLDPGEDVTVTLNVRRLAWIENARHTNWLADEFNRQADTSKLRGEGLGVVRVCAGAADVTRAMDEAKRAANALGLGLTPGLGAHASRPGLGLVLACAGLTALACAAALTFAPAWTPLPVLPALAAAIVRRRRMRPSDDTAQRPRHRWWTARTRMARASDLKTAMAGDDQNADVKRRVHAYAFQRSTLPLPCGTLAAIAAPPARTVAARTSLTRRPDALERADGPLLGTDASGAPVRAWHGVLFGGVALLGEPGGGKSNLMHGLVAHAANRHQTGDLLVVIESKGRDSRSVLDRLAPGLNLIDIADPSTPMIDVLGAGDPLHRAERFADLMRAALGEQQIGPRSRLQLRDAVMLALMADGSERLADRCRAERVATPAGWTETAARLLGSNGVSDARRLGRAVRFAVDTPEAADALERLHGPVDAKSGRPAVRDGELANQLNAPMNKMDLLAHCPAFTPGRPMLSWAALARRSDGHADARVMVNLGAPVKAALPDMGDDQRRLVGALLMRSLKDEIAADCGGWQSQGRHVRLFVDELTDVLGRTDRDAGGNADIIAWLRDKGRAFGVELTVGTQHTHQVDDDLLACLSGLLTVATFTQRSDLTAGVAAQAVGADAALVKALPAHTVAVRTACAPPDLTALPVMVLDTPHFDAMTHKDAENL